MKENADPKDWNALLRSEGMPEEPKSYRLGKRVPLGDGLGRKSGREEKWEDFGKKHSKMCPINLGVGINVELHQPNNRPVEDELFNR